MKIILFSYYWGIHAFENGNHAFKKRVHVWKTGFTFKKIKSSSCYWGFTLLRRGFTFLERG